MNPMIADVAELQVTDRIAQSVRSERARRLMAARRFHRRAQRASMLARHALVLATPAR